MLYPLRVVTAVTTGAPATAFRQRKVQVASAPVGRLAENRMLLFLAGHVLLGVAINGSAALATLHAAVAVGAGLWIGATSRRIERVAMAAAYLAACDVLWRMTDARIFYETGKYAVAAVLLLGLFRIIRSTHRAVLPIAYFALLLPSALLTVQRLSVLGAREYLSFNLSGPLTLAISVVFFAQLRARWEELRRVFFALLSPIVAVATVATLGIFGAGEIEFTSASNFATSGGFGPNQVSALLGLGALLCLLLFLREDRIGLRLLEAGLGLWMFGQAVLTFSRGGAFNLIVAAGVVLVVGVVRSGRRIGSIIAIAVLAIGGVLVFTQLDQFTDGALEKRFADTETSNRGNLAQADLDLWEENRLAGVGPGIAAFERDEYRYIGVSPHTEFTRLLAEHGALGLLAIVLLAAIVLRGALSARSRWGQAVTLSLAAWAATQMTHAAMRISAGGFVFGLAMVVLVDEGRARRRAAKTGV